MKTTDTGAWHRTSPFAILFFLGRIIRLITQNAWQSLAPLVVFAVSYKGDIVSMVTLIGGGVVTLLLIGSVLSWMFFRYQILEHSILIRSGVLKKKQLDIKFDRIQGVNTEQNPIYRYLGLVTVAFDTAGSSGSEGNLPAVTREFAEALQRQVGGSTMQIGGEQQAEATPAQALLRLDWRDMLRIALVDRRALIVLALLGPLLEKMKGRVGGIVEDLISQTIFGASQIGFSAGFIIVAALLLGVALLLLLISVAAAFLRFHKFELFLERRTLRSTGGLLTHHVHSMDLEKIQTLRLQQGVIQSWLRRFRLTAQQAVSSGRQRNKKLFVIPVVTAAQADELRSLLMAPEGGALTQDPRDRRFRPVSPYYMRSKILFVGLIPALIVGTTLYFTKGAIGLAALLWLPITVLAAWRHWRRAGFLYDGEEIVRRSGMLGYRTVSLLFRKVQRVTVTQSRYQGRKHLASLRMHMASGSVHIPYIDHDAARKLRDYILYKVESSKKAWH